MEFIFFVGIGWVVWKVSKSAIRNFISNYSIGESGEAGFAVLDFETSGLTPNNGSRVIQLGLVLLDRSGRIQETWTQLINPVSDVGPTYIHGITNEMVKNSPKFGEIADKLESLLQGRILVAHNAKFDVSFLVEEMKRAGKQVDLSSLIVFDTMTNADRFFAFLPDRKMETCVAFAGIDLSRLPGRGFHDAEFDTAAEAALFTHYLRTDRALVVRNLVLASSLKLSLVDENHRQAIDSYDLRNRRNLEYFEQSKTADFSNFFLNRGDEVIFLNVRGNEFDRMESWAKTNSLLIGERITKARTKLVIVGNSEYLSIHVELAVRYQLPIIPVGRIGEIRIAE
jgi:DNA polymerase III epsilon subunit family exonuclease